MKSLKKIGSTPAGVSLLSDDLIEFHAGRIMLLIGYCGVKSRKDKSIRIEGLTKLAKLDFFLRYPEFFRKAATHLNNPIEIVGDAPIESKMIRFHYGPWDSRYYQILPFLEARNVLKIVKENTTYNFVLTQTGIDAVNELTKLEQFNDLIANIKTIKKVLGGLNGTTLKNLVYNLFEIEVADKKLKESISYEL
ncbi:MAG TPA: hypothetical protein VK508_18555 [Cyclobacteriaceae bacterium]|nr:hypothetical protein [Cyclobacteriaceae bacterium]